MKITIPAKPKLIIDRLMGNGYEAGLVGGCLRNLLLNLEVKDYDIATSATTEEMKGIFSDLTIISLGEKFGTLIIVVEGENIEITTFRKESSYQDNRHPDQVEFINNIEEDLKRRDFTINALFYNDKTGLIDLFQSTKDLEEKIIRAVGNPMERFKEDSLRILRGLRFAAKLSFKIEDKTKKAILDSYQLLSNIKSERIAIELLEILNCDNISGLIKEYSHVFQQIVPNLANIESTINLDRLDQMPTLKLKLAIFFSGLKNPELAFDTMMDLKLTVSSRIRKSDLKDIALIIEYGNNKIYENISNITKENLIELFRAIKWNRTLLEEILIFNNQQKLLSTLPSINIKDLAIDGYDIMSLGFRDEKIGEILDDCYYNLLLEKIFNNKKALCDHITEIYSKKNIIRVD